MIRHIVMWNLKETAEGGTKTENALIIKERLEDLVGKIGGLLKAEVGINYVEGNADLCLYSEFIDKESLAEYRVHPLHKEVQSFVHKVIENRIASDSEWK